MKRRLPKGIEIYSRKDIIELIGFHNPIDSIICDDIISEMDKEIFDIVVINKGIARIPYIGNIQRNKTSELYRKSKDKIYRYRDEHPDMTRNEFNEYKKNVAAELAEKVRYEGRLRRLFRQNRTINKSEYIRRYKILGKHRADMFIWSLCFMKPVIGDNDET